MFGLCFVGVINISQYWANGDKFDSIAVQKKTLNSWKIRYCVKYWSDFAPLHLFEVWISIEIYTISNLIRLMTVFSTLKVLYLYCFWNWNLVFSNTIGPSIMDQIFFWINYIVCQLQAALGRIRKKWSQRRRISITFCCSNLWMSEVKDLGARCIHSRPA